MKVTQEKNQNNLHEKLTGKVKLHFFPLDGKFSAEKYEISDGNTCTYEGKITGTKVTAFYKCLNGGSFHFSATRKSSYDYARERVQKWIKVNVAKHVCSREEKGLLKRAKLEGTTWCKNSGGVDVFSNRKFWEYGNSCHLKIHVTCRR